MAGVFPNAGNRRVVVKNIPTNAKPEKLVIHFQKAKHGGRGDVASITFPKSLSEPGQAVIEFESAETLNSVLQCAHIFNGQQLDLRPFPKQSFEKAGVSLSDETVDLLKISGQYQKIIDRTGVELTSQHKKHHISGEWYQVSAAVELITQVTSLKANSQGSGSSCNSVGDPPLNASKQPAQGSSNGGAVPKTRRRRPSSGREVVQEEIPIDRNILDYMKRCHPDRLKLIGKKHKVKVQDEKSKVIIFPSAASGAKGVKDAANNFNRIYSKFHQEVRNIHFDLKSLKSTTEDEIQDAILSMNKQEKVFVGRSLKSGEESVVVFLALNEQDAKSTAENFQSMFVPEKGVVLREIIPSHSGLRVSVQHSDFRKEKVDALLSEVQLPGKGSILNACSEEIKDNVRNWLRTVSPHAWSNNPLHLSNAGDGILCKRIIHYYLANGMPIEESVQTALFMCLEFANEHQFTSVALPMNCLGAGVRTSNLNIAVFEAIQNFVASHQETRPTLKDIRIIHSNLAEAKRSESVLETLSDIESSSETGASSESRSSQTSTNEESQVESCPICLDDLTGAVSLKTLPCKHVFHQACIDRAFSVSKKCPMCMRFYGKPEGNQPRNAMMKSTITSQKLPGFSCDTIIIDYNVPSGTQGPEHPNPGQRYHGTTRTAFLPNNTEGRELLLLLRKAFDSRLVFTIGRSVTSGRDNCVTWSDIHHKTNMRGGPTGYGYPDPTYLSRLRMELADKGIRADTS